MTIEEQNTNEHEIATYEQNLDQMATEIQNLKSDTGDNEKARQDLDNKLNDSFLDLIKNYLNIKKDSQALNNLKTSIKTLLASHSVDSDFDEKYKNLIALAKILGIEGYHDEADNTEDNPEDAKQDLPELGLKKDVKLVGIKAVKSGETGEQKFHKGIDQKVELQEKSALDKMREDLKGQIDNIKAINLSKLPEDVKGETEQLKNLLVDMNNVVDNTTSDNVKLLQIFISDNLEGEDKTNFDKASKKANEQFDGMFGDGTLAGLNIVLEKTGKYIDDVKELLKQNETSDDLDKVKAKENATVQKDAEINPEDLVEGRSEGVKVTLDEGQELKTDVVNKEIEVNLTAKSGEKKKPLVVKVKVVEKTSEDSDEDESDQPSTNTEPIKIGEEQYQVMNNSSDIATNTGLTGATFYSTLPYSSSVEGEGDGSEVQPQLAQTTNEDGGDRIYNMRLRDRPDEIYRVKVDAQGNICPTGKNRESNASVVFGNYVSCMRYLKNKLPPVLQDKDVNIGWNGKDYIISLGKGKRRLTVEPMTIDGNWEASNNLTDCLAFLNFTNYLRNKKDLYDIAFKNNNPDLKLEGNELYVRVNKKSNIIYDDEWKVKKMGKRLKVNKEQFGLPNDTDKLNKFIKYNNGEHWRDDWDKKKLNKYYKLIKLS